MSGSQFGEYWFPGNIHKCLRTFLVVTIRGGSAAGIQWIEVMGVAQHPPMDRTGPPTTNNYLLPNVNSAQVQKPCFTWTKYENFTQRMKLLCASLNMPYRCYVLHQKCPFFLHLRPRNLHLVSPSTMCLPSWRGWLILSSISDLPTWFCGNMHGIQSQNDIALT